MKKLQLRKKAKYIQYSAKNWPYVYDFIHNNPTNFKYHAREPEGDLLLDTTTNGFRVKEGDYIVLSMGRLYCVRQELFKMLFVL